MSNVHANAAAVSATLRRAGIRPLPSGTPRGREGIRVSAGGPGYTLVTAFFVRTVDARNAIEFASEALDDAGYTFEVHLGGESMTVKKGESP